MKPLEKKALTELRNTKKVWILLHFPFSSEEITNSILYRANGSQIIEKLKEIFDFEDWSIGFEGVASIEMESLFLEYCEEVNGRSADDVELFSFGKGPTI